MWVKFSLSAYYFTGPANPMAVPTAPSIVACHVDQRDAAIGEAGLPPRIFLTPGPGQYRISFLHYQADSTPTIPLVPAGPGYEMTCVNYQLAVGGSTPQWQFIFQMGEIVCTEIHPVEFR
jgi:hypothetical protein